jgi:hypothetical protein
MRMGANSAGIPYAMSVRGGGIAGEDAALALSTARKDVYAFD